MFAKIIKSFILVFALSFIFIACGNNVNDNEESAQIHQSFVPAVYSLEELAVTNRNQVAGGNGDLIVKYAFVRDNAPADFTTKEMGYMTLMPGDSVGLHKHEGNEDSYLIVSGVGTYTDEDGSQYEIKAGDMTICRSGHSHALSNSGQSPLIFFAVLSGK